MVKERSWGGGGGDGNKRGSGVCVGEAARAAEKAATWIFILTVN